MNVYVASYNNEFRLDAYKHSLRYNWLIMLLSQSEIDHIFSNEDK